MTYVLPEEAFFSHKGVSVELMGHGGGDGHIEIKLYGYILKQLERVFFSLVCVKKL